MNVFEVVPDDPASTTVQLGGMRFARQQVAS